VKKLSIIYPYYEAPRMLAVQLATWCSWPKGVWNFLDIVLVDDGSPRHPAKDLVWSLFKLNGTISNDIKIYRIHEDKTWNNHGARNLGAWVSESDYLLMLDIKHTIPASCIDNLAYANLSFDDLYVFPCVWLDLESGYSWMMTKEDKPIKPHPNTFLVGKNVFWNVGGYDEDYCGTYGGDGPMMRSLERVTERRMLNNFHVIRWDRSIISDSMVDMQRDGKCKAAYRKLMESKNPDDKPINPIRFTWEREL
jgi:hypothetical protein